ncbi:DUF6950 family protein [Pseudooceanicola sp. C21-150M6]|uniref:DUF6950 family protein n=1 Tax=Pseudooceanicola sp. C21-150M6 TaxID=3434355 RepID=UPI003D7F8249
MTVIEAVRLHMAGPFEWVSADCFSATDEVLFALFGIRPFASLRDAYSGPVSAARLARQRGGYVAGVTALCRDAGMRETDDPQPGDLVMIAHNGPLGAVLGICVGGGWTATKGKSGIRYHRGPILGAMTWVS